MDEDFAGDGGIIKRDAAEVVLSCRRHRKHRTPGSTGSFFKMKLWTTCLFTGTSSPGGVNGFYFFRTYQHSRPWAELHTCIVPPSMVAR